MCRSTESAARVAERLARQLRAVLGSVPSTHTKAGFGVASAWEGAWQWLVCSGWCAHSGAAEDITEYYVRHLRLGEMQMVAAACVCAIGIGCVSRVRVPPRRGPAGALDRRSQNRRITSRPAEDRDDAVYL